MTTNRAAKLLINQLNEQIDIIRKVRHDAELAFCVSYRTGNNEEATMRASMEADSAWDRHLRFIAATYGALYNVLNVEYMYVSQAEIEAAINGTCPQYQGYSHLSGATCGYCGQYTPNPNEALAA